MPPPDRFARRIKKPRTRDLHRRTLYVMVIHAPLRLFNAELRERPIWRNVGIRGNDERVHLGSFCSGLDLIQIARPRITEISRRRVIA